MYKYICAVLETLLSNSVSFICVYVDLGCPISTLNSSTAVGFDERMLLHSEVWRCFTTSLPEPLYVT